MDQLPKFRYRSAISWWFLALVAMGLMLPEEFYLCMFACSRVEPSFQIQKNKTKKKQREAATQRLCHIDNTKIYMNLFSHSAEWRVIAVQCVLFGN